MAVSMGGTTVLTKLGNCPGGVHPFDEGVGGEYELLFLNLFSNRKLIIHAKVCYLNSVSGQSEGLLTFYPRQ